MAKFEGIEGYAFGAAHVYLGELVDEDEFVLYCGFDAGEHGDGGCCRAVIGTPCEGGADHVGTVGVAFLHLLFNCFSCCHRLHGFAQNKCVCDWFCGEGKEIFIYVNINFNNDTLNIIIVNINCIYVIMIYYSVIIHFIIGNIIYITGYTIFNFVNYNFVNFIINFIIVSIIYDFVIINLFTVIINFVSVKFVFNVVY